MQCITLHSNIILYCVLLYTELLYFSSVYYSTQYCCIFVLCITLHSIVILCRVSFYTILQYCTIPFKFTISLQEEHPGIPLDCTSLTKTTSTGLAYAVGTDPVTTTSTGLATATSTGLTITTSKRLAPATTINIIKIKGVFSVILTNSLNSSVDQTENFPV